MKIGFTPSDIQLINSYKVGDNQSMGILYQRYSKKVYYKCFSFLKNEDDAFDVSQDILLKSFEKIHSFKGGSSFSTWLYSITTNHCLEYLRKKNKTSFSSFNEHWDIADEIIDNTESILINQKEEAIINIIQKMPQMDKELLLMKYENNASVRELQQQFTLSASAVKMRLMRARQKVMNSYEANIIKVA
jgi:RNA polymerase sigma factor (sigma-70 family)